MIAVSCLTEGMQAFTDETNILIICIFMIFFIFGGSWLIRRVYVWKRQPSDLVSIDENGNLIIYSKSQITIAKDELISIIAMPENLFIKFFGGGYGAVTIETTIGTYKVLFVDQADAIPDKIKQAMHLN